MRSKRVWLAVGCTALIGVAGFGLTARAMHDPGAAPVRTIATVATVADPVSSDSTAAADVPVYELPPPPSPGLAPVRVGAPLPQAEALAAINVTKGVLGHVDRGVPCSALANVTREQAKALPMVAFGHAIDGECYVLGWLDNVALQASAPRAGEDIIPFVYDDDGVALSSFPFPDEEAIPADFPLPPSLEHVRAG